MFNQHLWILGCAQNSARYLPQIFFNLERCQSLFAGSTILVFENDSQDGTRYWLRDYGLQRSTLKAQTFKGLNYKIPVKTVRLAALRNAGIDWLRALGAFDSPKDLVMILDFDEVNADQWDICQWEQTLSWFMARDQAGAIFPNQLGPYYDLWAFRHPQLCPQDVWWQVYQMHLQNPLWNDDQCLNAGYTPRQLTLPPDREPIMVESAFGGLGLYKVLWLRRAQVPYSGEHARWISTEDDGSQFLRWQVCEHVSFHAGLRAAGASLWIHPGWINWNTQAVADRGGLRPNPAAWRHLAF